MQGIFHHGGRSRLAVLVLATGLTAACSTYRPLDGGSDVPWAQRQGGVGLASLATGHYRVQPGDRLSQLALRYGVAVQALAEANRLEAPYVIYTGQSLRIPGLIEGGSAPAMAMIGDRYVVRRGDTLSGIAQRIDVPIVQLAAANQLATPYAVYAGQKLRIPATERAVVEPAASKIGLAPVAHGKAPPLSGQGFLWPVNGKVIGGFGPLGEGQRRDGIDIAAREGAPVVAAEDGIVAYAGEGIRTLGRLILIRHDQGYITTYAHNAALLVDAGTAVQRGQVIARVGSTGDVARPLLHFELRKGRQPLDPETVLVREATALASTQ